MRPARASDAPQIHALVSLFSSELLARSLDDIVQAIDAYVVAVDGRDNVVACAALSEYSPSLGEVSSVAVAPAQQGRGLGSLVVRGIEALAQRRGIEELFAVSNATRFFESLGYARVELTTYPEKLARYAALGGRGVHTARKPCFRKVA